MHDRSICSTSYEYEYICIYIESRWFGVSTFWSVDVSACCRFGLSTFWSSTCRFFDLLSSYQFKDHLNTDRLAVHWWSMNRFNNVFLNKLSKQHNNPSSSVCQENCYIINVLCHIKHYTRSSIFIDFHSNIPDCIIRLITKFPSCMASMNNTLALLLPKWLCI